MDNQSNEAAVAEVQTEPVAAQAEQPVASIEAEQGASSETVQPVEVAAAEPVAETQAAPEAEAPVQPSTDEQVASALTDARALFDAELQPVVAERDALKDEVADLKAQLEAKSQLQAQPEPQPDAAHSEQVAAADDEGEREPSLDDLVEGAAVVERHLAKFVRWVQHHANQSAKDGDMAANGVLTRVQLAHGELVPALRALADLR